MTDEQRIRLALDIIDRELTVESPADPHLVLRWIKDALER